MNNILLLRFTTSSWASICFLLASGLVFAKTIGQLNSQAIERMLETSLFFEPASAFFFAVLFGQAAGERQASIPLTFLASLMVSLYSWLAAKVLFPEIAIAATIFITIVNMIVQFLCAHAYRPNRNKLPQV